MFMMSGPPQKADVAAIIEKVGSGPIPLKKSKMPLQQNSRKSDLVADFGRRCPLRVCRKVAE
jgi:hypothetical protein